MELIRQALALALPARCPGCTAIVAADHSFCASCWADLRFLGPPWCAACNLPFAFDRGPDARCGDCLSRPPQHAGVRAAVAYGPVARTVALRLKYAGRAAFAETAARLMRRALPDDTDLLVPVPLHRWRLWARGYNQAALIAAALGRLAQVPADPLLLHRGRVTPVLRGLNPGERRRAVAGAFHVAPARRTALNGRVVVLVDDVHTSGATADAATRVLLAAGAARVTVLCWARVLGDAAD